MSPRSSDERESNRTVFMFSIYAMAFVVGAIVMAFEMLGSRYLNPYFGSGIFTWASLIATILFGLTIGYFLGGWLADRWPKPNVLGALVGVASLYMLTVPLFANALFEVIFDLVEDVRFGSLVAAIALMIFPVSLLGVYSPFAIRLTLSTTKHSGRVAGRIYGVSTLGSIVGTMVTTFYLIPAIGTAMITLCLGVVGVASSLVIFMASAIEARSLRNDLRAALCLVVCGLALAMFSTHRVAASEAERFTAEELLEMPDSLLENIESEYNNIYIRKAGNYVKMSFRRYGSDYTESVADLVDKTSLPVPYTQVMTVGLPFAGNLGSMVMIGLGGGSTSSYLARHLPEMTVDVVELDPGVIDASYRYFGIQNGLRYRVHESDGRVFLMRNKNFYDIIMVDAFRGGYVPFHMLTTEFYGLIKKRLAPGGVAVFNVHSGTKLFLATVSTLKSTFRTVLGFRVANWGGNVILVASEDEKLRSETIWERATKRQNLHNFRYNLLQLLQRTVNLAELPEGEILTDDFAPVNLYEAIEVENAKRW